MTKTSSWRSGPKKVTVVVDNDSWILPYALDLVTRLKGLGHQSTLCRNHDEIEQGDIAFYLGCVRITPEAVLARNQYNLVVHESSLPTGRGFAPLTWQILEGKNEVPVCLIEAAADVDAGVIYDRSTISFEGHELNAELRHQQGKKSIQLCERFCERSAPPQGQSQQGEPSFYARRRPKDSELDINKSILSQFQLLRVVDNERYPAFFTHAGHQYRLRIEKVSE